MFKVVVAEDARRIDAWSDVRLPFEPRGELLEFRTRLRVALAALHAGPGEVLHAVYTSQSDRFVDTENVLLYNVGAAAFRGSARSGLCFERRFTRPDDPSTPGWAPTHHHSYAVTGPTDTSGSWRRVRRIAWWPQTAVPTAALRSPGPAWLAARHALRVDGDASAGSVFALTLRVGGRVAPASAVKPIFDGMIAALHAHDGTAKQEIVRRLSGLLNLDQRETGELLSGVAPLGVRTLVRLRGDGLQWNPEDERCVVGCLMAVGGTPSFSGEVWEVVSSDPGRERPPQIS